MKQLLFSLSLLLITNSYACLNESGVNLKGESTVLDMVSRNLFLKPKIYPSQSRIVEKLAELRDRLTKSTEENKDDLYSDIGMYMILNGDYQEAIDYMHANIQVKNENYRFCSNIGVAYELVGNLDSALFWTQKGLDLNPNSHEGSEWIHIKILEAEIAIQQDKNWLNRNTLFGFPISKDSIPTVFPKGFNLKKFTFESGIQLLERSYFVHKENQDQVFSQLILLHADAVARAYDTKKCLPIYTLAAEHDNSLQALVNKRIAYLKAHNAKMELSEAEVESGAGLDDERESIFADSVVVDTEQLEVISESVEEPKKEKKIINGLIYYLGAGFVLLVIGMVFFLRKKPKGK